jgi:hypothetical protein
VSAAANARVLHAVLTGSTAVTGALLAALRGAVPIGPLSDTVGTVLRAVILALVLGATVGLRVLKGTMPAPAGEKEVNAWWRAHQGRAVALWALAEGVGVAGAALYFVSGDPILLAVPMAWAIGMLLWYSPGRLLE